VGIPGTNGSIATVYDGYEFTKQGDPVRALSAGTVANFIGTLPSIVIAMFLSRGIAMAAVKLGPWEFFALGCCAIVMITALSEGNMLKGLFGAAIGLMLTTVGRAPVSGTLRFNFGSYYLSGGFNLVSVMMGIFAGRIILTEYIRAERLNNAGPVIKISGFHLPLKDFTGNIVNIIRSFFIGLWIGFLPGLGAGLSNVTAYVVARNSSKHPEKFGKGIIDGVWAPETANNASVGGAIIPMIALGIPGDSFTAILLSGLIIQGIEAGPLLIRTQPVLVYMIFAAAIFGAVFVLLVEILGMRLFPMLLRVPYHILYPCILALCFTGAYVTSGNIIAIFIAIVCTLFGMWMAYADIPSTPFVLTFILGGMLEKNFRNGVSFSPDYGLMSFFIRPVSCALLILAVFLLFWPAIKKRIALNKRKPLKDTGLASVEKNDIEVE
jgi:putative tricarboxylic transport membrane protein